MPFELFFSYKKFTSRIFKKILSHVLADIVWSAPHVSLVCGGFNEKKIVVHLSSAHSRDTAFLAEPKKNI